MGEFFLECLYYMPVKTNGDKRVCITQKNVTPLTRNLYQFISLNCGVIRACSVTELHHSSKINGGKKQKPLTIMSL